MDPGVRSPLVDFFRKGEVTRDIRIMAAQGAFAPAALDQLALLIILHDDNDPEIAAAARATVAALPTAPLAAFIARSEVPGAMRDWFVAHGVEPVAGEVDVDNPLVDTSADEEVPADVLEAVAAAEADEEKKVKLLSNMNVTEKVKVAMRGTREARAVLIRDPNRMVAAAVLSSPKLTDNEVEQFARMANVGEEVLRVIGMNRRWMKNYGVAANLVRNPKTPVGMSLNLMHRLNDRDVKMLATDRNIPEPIRIAARKRAAEKREKG